MNYRDFFDKALSEAYREAPVTDDRTFVGEICERADNMKNNNERKHRLFTAVAGTAAAVAVVGGGVLGVNYLNQYGGLKEGGGAAYHTETAETTAAVTAEVTAANDGYIDIREPELFTLADGSTGYVMSAVADNNMCRIRIALHSDKLNYFNGLSGERVPENCVYPYSPDLGNSPADMAETFPWGYNGALMGSDENGSDIIYTFFTPVKGEEFEVQIIDNTGEDKPVVDTVTLPAPGAEDLNISLHTESAETGKRDVTLSPAGFFIEQQGGAYEFEWNDTHLTKVMKNGQVISGTVKVFSYNSADTGRQLMYGVYDQPLNLDEIYSLTFLGETFVLSDAQTETKAKTEVPATFVHEAAAETITVNSYEFDGKTLNINYDTVFDNELEKYYKPESRAFALVDGMKNMDAFSFMGEPDENIKYVFMATNSISDRTINQTMTVELEDHADSLDLIFAPTVHEEFDVPEYTFTATVNAENVAPAVNEETGKMVYHSDIVDEDFVLSDAQTDTQQGDLSQIAGIFPPEEGWVPPTEEELAALEAESAANAPQYPEFPDSVKNDDFYGEFLDQPLVGDEAWELVKERGGIDLDYPFPYDKSLFVFDGAEFYINYADCDVTALVGGTVEFAGWYLGFGQTVLIHDENGHYWQFSHLSEISAEQGDTVEAGDKVGHTGTSGVAFCQCYAMRVG